MKIAENFTKNPGSAVTATVLLTLLAITAIVLPIMTLVGRYSGALKEFMKTSHTIAGRSAGQNWMYVAGAGLVIFVAGGVAAGLSFRRKPEPPTTQTKQTQIRYSTSRTRTTSSRAIPGPAQPAGADQPALSQADVDALAPQEPQPPPVEHPPHTSSQPVNAPAQENEASAPNSDMHPTDQGAPAPQVLPRGWMYPY